MSVQFVLPLFFVEPFVIPTGAMEDTILIGDHIVFQTVPRFIPARGDIVAFIYPVDRRQTFVKRIAGVPGNRIRFSGKALYRNEVRADELVHMLRSFVGQEFEAKSTEVGGYDGFEVICRCCLLGKHGTAAEQEKRKAESDSHRFHLNWSGGVFVRVA